MYLVWDRHLNVIIFRIRQRFSFTYTSWFANTEMYYTTGTVPGSIFQRCLLVLTIIHVCV